ncbi:MAG: HU family DNA-binding protein [Prevotella sp.]|jgi:predicted histone-like DNA-binding protein|nr:HU family DNA-binding protein [Prevotella sp.]MCI2125810.1 HU family DNA-binding protein [Prevotella sp.]
MSVAYKLYQLNHKGNKSNGLWCARPCTSDTIDVNKLAEKIQSRCTVTLPDIVAVISALVDAMREGLQEGKRIYIDRFGTFKVGIHCIPAPTAKDFSVASNVKRLHVLFHPITTVDNKKHMNSLLSGCKLKEMDAYDKPTKTDGSSNGVQA